MGNSNIESAFTLASLGAGILWLGKRYGVAKTALGLYALDQFVFRKWRASNASEHGSDPARSWDLNLSA
jgi:hypothetical protein